ncbi:DUF5320 domain-containing protein [Candidatus Neomarinimicrobiota bacterium]
MPRGDRTGPGGMGPMTGRAAGYCGGYATPGYTNPGPRAGLGFAGGFSRGAGRGWRNMYYATGLAGWQRGLYPSQDYPQAGPYRMPVAQTMTKQQEVEALKGQTEYFESALGEIRKRLDELESEPEK